MSDKVEAPKFTGMSRAELAEYLKPKFASKPDPPIDLKPTLPKITVVLSSLD
jgi:hypothetical protein